MSLLRKGAISRRGGLPTFKPEGLAPQKVVTNAGGSDPTRDTYQRKVFYDGTYFFVFWYNATDKVIYYSSSSTGDSWGSAVNLESQTNDPYAGGNIDVECSNPLNDKGHTGVIFDLAVAYSRNNTYWRELTYSKSSGVLTYLTSTAVSGPNAQGGGLIYSLLDHIYWTFHRSSYLGYGYLGSLRANTTSISYGGATTGGAQSLRYKTSSPYTMLALAKDASNVLYWNTLRQDAAALLGSWVSIATLGTGFSDFCGCSEAQNIGDPERVHLVYIKSTGELCYRKFENDAWSSEKVLVASGATYPVIACGAGGRRYVFYVKDGKVWVTHYKGAWLNPVELFTGDHTYDTPAYLSCNQNVQSGNICLVWVEGAASPYEVWFCYLED